MSFTSVWETFQQMQYMDLWQLINAIESAEHLALNNLRIKSFRDDGEVGKVQKEKKQLPYLVLLFIVTFILRKAITENM